MGKSGPDAEVRAPELPVEKYVRGPYGNSWRQTEDRVEWAKLDNPAEILYPRASRMMTVFHPTPGTAPPGKKEESLPLSERGCTGLLPELEHRLADDDQKGPG